MRHWAPPVKRYIDSCCNGPARKARQDFQLMRWVASMVADVHRILTRRHLHVSARQSASQKPGKLRLLTDQPMSFLIEQAGGAIPTAGASSTSCPPNAERVSVVLGSKNEVDRVTAYHREAA